MELDEDDNSLCSVSSNEYNYLDTSSARRKTTAPTTATNTAGANAKANSNANATPLRHNYGKKDKDRRTK